MTEYVIVYPRSDSDRSDEYRSTGYNTLRAHAYYSLVPSSDAYVHGSTLVPLHDIETPYLHLLIEDAEYHYQVALRKWETSGRDQLMSRIRIRVLEPLESPMGDDDESVTQVSQSGLTRESLNTELDVFEMILTFLAGESEWLRLAPHTDPYGPHVTRALYYTQVANDFVTGNILNKIKMDEYIFQRAREFTYYDYLYTETTPPPYFPTPLVDDSEKDVFVMDD